MSDAAPLPEPRPASASSPGFVTGGTYALRGLAFLARNRSLWPVAAVPLLVMASSLALFLSGGAFLVDDAYRALLPDFVASSAPDLPWYAALGHGATSALVGLGAFVLTMAGALLGSLALASALGGPFNELLSEAVERRALGREVGEPLDPRQVARDVARGAVGALGRLVLWGVVYVPLALGSLIPGIGLAFAAGTVAYSCFFLGINFLDPVLDRKRLTLKEKLDYARAHLGSHLGFGAGAFALLLIPLAAIVVGPGLVAGGTLLFLDRGGLGPELAARAAARGPRPGSAGADPTV